MMVNLVGIRVQLLLQPPQQVGSSSTSAPTSATVTRVLWYSNTPAPSSNENQFGLSSQQDVSQSAPQHSQQCSGNNGGGT
ncbi:hypothetical protein ACOSQ3_028478 [Xanthoceras sorbifolium]